MTDEPMRRALLAGTLVSIAALLAAPNRALAADRFADIHRVGLITALGDEVEIAHFGFPAANRQYTDLAVADWDLDGYAARKVRELVGDRVQLAPAHYDEASFLPPADGKSDERNPRLGPLIAALPTDVDAYLIVRKVSWAGPGWVLGGIGVEHSKLALVSSHGMVHVMLEIALVQAGTGKVLASKHNGVPSRASEKPGEWADSADQLTDAQKQALRENIEALISREIGSLLPALGLAGA